MNPRIAIIGNVSGTNVGGSLERAARAAGYFVRSIPTAPAMRAPWIWRQFNWRLRGRRPPRLEQFGRQTLAEVLGEKCNVVISCGGVPLSRQVLAELGRQGIRRGVLLTDDPWNRAHRAPWFLDALPEYDAVFTPRRMHMDDIRRTTSAPVSYVPFGWDPELFFPPEVDEEARRKWGGEVVFAGGADVDRVQYFQALDGAGIDVALYGDYWRRFAATRKLARGQIDVGSLRIALKASDVCLCLVRRANRDEHCMRSFEVPGVGGCMLTEDTRDHRELFGEEGVATLYFSGVGEMVDKTRWLLAHPEDRNRLAAAAASTLRAHKHTYADRLETMLAALGVLRG